MEFDSENPNNQQLQNNPNFQGTFGCFQSLYSQDQGYPYQFQQSFSPKSFINII